MNQLHHLYINPTEKCNLRCRICYTKKTRAILTEAQILDFIERYRKEIELQTVTFCGGEAFVLPFLIHCINALSYHGIFVQVITNGTIDRLIEIENPNSVNLIVSLDGLEPYHDKNRGKDNFQKSLAFLKKAKRMGFHTEIFSIVTRQNINEIPTFERLIEKTLGITDITYHPRKPLNYLNVHPVSNIAGETNGFEFLTNKQIVELMKTKKTFPPRELGCFQISLMSDGKVYGCCEGFAPIGTIGDPIKYLIRSLKSRVEPLCLGCVQPDFMCGIKDIILKQ